VLFRSRGAVIELVEGVEGYLRASDIKEERVEDATRELSVGDKIEAKFISLDRKNRTLSLSVRAKEDAELAEALKEYKSSSATGGTTSLGDLLKEQLEQDS
jgi:small subunit ribosomal protein S1